MINLAEEDNISLINELVSKDVRNYTNFYEPNFLRHLVRFETKPDKFENRIISSHDNKTYLISIKNNNKPNKIEASFHLLDIKRIESSNKSQLIISTNEIKEIRLRSFEETEIDDQSPNVIDEIIRFYCITFLKVYPSITIIDIIDVVTIIPEQRLHLIYSEIIESKDLNKKLQICGSYPKAYLMICNMMGNNWFKEVKWDINAIYGQNSLNEFSLNDFDYINSKDCIPLIAALKYNSWFEGFSSDGIKLTNEMQDELVKVLAVPVCKIQNLSITQANLKHDFVQRLLNAFQTVKTIKKYNSETNAFIGFKQINLSRNTLEDKGVVLLTNLFKEIPKLCQLTSLILSKCTLTSKSVNTLFTSISWLKNTLTCLDLSYNNLKEEPTELYKFISDSNELQELNLAHCDLDVDKLFNSLGRGGCDKNLKKLILTGNLTFSKITILDLLIKFLKSTKSLSHFDLSACKLSGTLLQVMLANLKLNPYLAANNNGFYLNLSSNDLGSCLKSFMFEFNSETCITSLDLSENNLDTDSDVLLAQIERTRIKSLCLSRNFQNSKPKLNVKKIIETLNSTLSKYSHLQNLWLADCKLKSNLNDLINELGSFSQLRLLDISGNEIGDLGFNYLSKSLQVNRSLQTLMFDKSNVSIQAYVNIIEALKRNFTLKSLQMPVNDICTLYPRSPEKVIDIAKQMSELFSQRNLLLNSQNKCDLDQLFKAKMKLINEPNLDAFSHSSSNNLMTTKNKNNRADEETNLDGIHSPQYIKEILQTLNESASTYLNNKPIENEFSKFSSQILEKIDDIAFKLENELHSTLNKKYTKYAASIPYSKDTNDSSISDIVKLNSLKNNIKDYMNTMIIQIHNDICEMTYNLSTTMAEKLIYETTLSSSNNNTNTSNSITTPSTNATTNNNSLNLNRSQENNINNNTDSNVSILSKKIAGGIRLPFLPAVNSNNLNSTGIQSTKNETETTSNSNSKSKRPISSQLQDFNLVSPTSTTTATTSEFKLNKQHNKSASSSSNENLVDVGSEDDLEIKKINNKIISNSASREKTPEQQQKSNLIESKSPTINDYNSEENQINSSFQPVPAPRKQKSGPLSKDGIKSFFRINSGVGNPSAPFPTTGTTATSSTSSQSIMSPKLGRKPILTSVTETSNNTIKIEDLDNNNETSQLNHLNKSRPKRQNVKKPTAKNPLSNIESEILEESLSTNVNDTTLPNSKSNQNNNINKESENENEQQQQQQSSSNDLSENKKVSPVISVNKSNLFPEQPKINLTILEQQNKMLRKTIVKHKIETVNQPQSESELMTTSQIMTTPTSTPASSKLANRVSMFEQTNLISNIKPKKILETNQENNNSDEVTNSAQDSQSTNKQVSKPLPPIPLNKPRPTFSPQTSITTNGNTKVSIFNKDNTNKEESVKPPTGIMVKLRPVNGNNINKELTNNENIPTSTNTADDSQPEKRSSVKELTKMLNEESKA